MNDEPKGSPCGRAGPGEALYTLQTMKDGEKVWMLLACGEGLPVPPATLPTPTPGLTFTVERGVPGVASFGRSTESEADRQFAIQMSDRISKASPDYMAELANALGNRWAAFTDDELLALFERLTPQAAEEPARNLGNELLIEITTREARAAQRTEPA